MKYKQTLKAKCGLNSYGITGSCIPNVFTYRVSTPLSIQVISSKPVNRSSVMFFFQLSMVVKKSLDGSIWCMRAKVGTKFKTLASKIVFIGDCRLT